MSEIVVPDPADARAVICAFQRAIDSVLNADTVGSFSEGYFDEMWYQNVYCNGSPYEIGCANFLLGKPTKPVGVLSVRIYTPGHRKGQVSYVAEHVVQRLAISIRGMSETARLKPSPNGRNHVAAYLTAPIETLMSHPKGQIMLLAS